MALEELVVSVWLPMDQRLALVVPAVSESAEFGYQVQ